MNRLAMILPLASIAACGSEPDVKMENASVAEVAEEMRQAGAAKSLNPGKWEHKIDLIEFDMPGMSPAEKSVIQNAIDRVQRYEHCLTPEQAAKPSEDFFTQANQNCRFEHYEWANGKIDMKMNCTTAEGQMTMVQTGRYGADAFSTAMTQTTSAGGTQHMSIKAKVEARRIGDCDGKEQAEAGN